MLNNAKLVYDGTSWTLEGDASAQWPSDEDLDFYAYYPYDERCTNPLDITFNIQSEQADTESFASSNLMLARTIGVARGATVCMMFYPVLTLVDVNFAPIDSDADETQVLLSDVCNSVKVNLAASELKAELNESSRGDVSMYPYSHSSEEGYEYRAWVPAQTVMAGSHLLKFRYSGWRENGRQHAAGEFVAAFGRNNRHGERVYRIPSADPNHRRRVHDGHARKRIRTYLHGDPAQRLS